MPAGWYQGVKADVTFLLKVSARVLGGITVHHINDPIFHFVYELALRDATLQKAYPGSTQPLRTNQDAKKIVRAYIDAVIHGCAEQALFWSTAKQLEVSFAKHLPKAAPPFTFGNVQKLINMTAKYLFIACYNRHDLRGHFRFCHCPMDSIMVDIAIKELKAIQKTALQADEVITLNRFLKRGNKTLLRKPWSKIESTDVAQYVLYQEIIAFLATRRDVSPIEYDFLMWNNHSNMESRL